MTNLQFPCLLLLAYILTPTLHAQQYDNNWYFGDRAGINFSTGSPVGQTGELITLEGCASISNFNGDLLFYTDGSTVYDRNHDTMPNGTGLAGGWSSSQSAIIVPLPGSTRIFYIFTTEDFDVDGGLAYSIVDMTLNAGNGDVIASSKNTSLVARTTEKVAATFHANKRDIWILTHGLNSNSFYAFRLTPDGITAPAVISSLGVMYGNNQALWYTGQLRISHNGKKIASSLTSSKILELYDFDATTGMLSNHFRFPEDKGFYGMEFSPNDSILYLAHHNYDFLFDTNYLLQYHYRDATPHLDTIGETISSLFENKYGSLQLGPDGKIYLNSYSDTLLHVIHQPNLPGLACQYEENAIPLDPGTQSYYGFPQKVIALACPLIALDPSVTRCVGDSVLLIINLQSTTECPMDFIWDDGSAAAERVIDISGTYWIEVTTPDTFYRDSITISFIDALMSSLAAAICEGESFEGHTAQGIHTDTFSSSFGCDSIRTLHLTVHPASQVVIEKTILQGGFFEGYNTSGIYRDTFESVNGCDSIRTIYLTVVKHTSVINYSLNACESVMAYGTHMDYSEFIATYPNPLQCAAVSANHIYRIPPEKHSCTPGNDDNPAMCVTTLNSCSYDAGNSKSIIIEFTIDPPADSAVHVTLLTFHERSPTEYNWINGPTGPNNRPLYYGIRILKNGVEIFRDEQQVTQIGWNPESYFLHERSAFRCDSTTLFRIELLPYCPVGNGAVESVWDIDNVNIYAGCVSPLQEKPFISGHVRHPHGFAMPNVRVDMSPNQDFTNISSTTTDDKGFYRFTDLGIGQTYYLRCFKDDDHLENVNAQDILKIRKHLLGIQSFASLRSLVAADINQSNTVNAMDIVALQKTLLGITTSFTNNTSWRFGVLPQDFRIMNLAAFKEVYYFESLNSSLSNIDFIGIKIGNID